jgi:ABC-type Zn2+ transport system substrate-binding protein/surface adhesin
LLAWKVTNYNNKTTKSLIPNKLR